MKKGKREQGSRGAGKTPHRGTGTQRKEGNYYDPSPWLRGSVRGILLFSLFFVNFAAYAQSADWIEALLASDRVTYADAALLVLQAAGHIESARGTSAEAFAYAAERNWLPKGAARNNTVRLSGLSLLVMCAFDIKGGLFYTLTKSPHHAYRELAYRAIIQGRTDPLMPVSGDLLLFTVNRVLTIRGE